MDNRIFRKSSIDRVNSPDRVDDCLTVPETSPWLIIVALLLLLIGMGVWTMFSNSEQRIPAIVRVEDGVGHCVISRENAGIARGKGVVMLETRTVPVMIRLGEEKGANVSAATFDVVLDDGLYNGELLVYVKPIDDPKTFFRGWRSNK